MMALCSAARGAPGRCTPESASAARPYYRTYPAYVEDEVEDGSYVSARWPGDAYLFSRLLLARLAPAW